ncbi:PREDICTED: uncharacterized protein LOC104813583 [Tarenaya hassleriana]|uniref:uncharacterized protein LOC104813583 n=1 Tax=Tarenaya hassleriana TaxID=28532 RepID=UPI00053C3570|nr:PREDICTED: uncharacterized protein LOC104813583 [Tarenaya hassleriana]
MITNSHFKNAPAAKLIFFVSLLEETSHFVSEISQARGFVDLCRDASFCIEEIESTFYRQFDRIFSHGSFSLRRLLMSWCSLSFSVPVKFAVASSLLRLYVSCCRSSFE